MVVNVETGGYACFPTGDFDRAVDAGSANPGGHLYEKMVSGGYFGQIARQTISGGVDEGLFSSAFVLPDVMEMADICTFLDAPSEKSGENQPVFTAACVGAKPAVFSVSLFFGYQS